MTPVKYTLNEAETQLSAANAEPTGKAGPGWPDGEAEGEGLVGEAELVEGKGLPAGGSGMDRVGVSEDPPLKAEMMSPQI